MKLSQLLDQEDQRQILEHPSQERLGENPWSMKQGLQQNLMMMQRLTCCWNQNQMQQLQMNQMTQCLTCQCWKQKQQLQLQCQLQCQLQQCQWHMPWQLLQLLQCLGHLVQGVEVGDVVEVEVVVEAVLQQVEEGCQVTDVASAVMRYMAANSVGRGPPRGSMAIFGEEGKLSDGFLDQLEGQLQNQNLMQSCKCYSWVQCVESLTKHFLKAVIGARILVAMILY